jgi:hypothetical protein
MSLIRGMTLDRATQAALSRLIAQLPDAAVIEYARSTPSFAAGGFRTHRAPQIRNRIDQLAKSAEPINASLRRLLARFSLNARGVAPLSVAFLNDHEAALADLFGAAPMRLARLLDERAEIREREGERSLAAVELDAGAVDDSERVARAACLLREHLVHLLDTVAAAAPGKGGLHGNGGASGEAQARLEGQLKDARAALRTLKGIESRALRLQKQLEASQADLKRAQASQAAAAAAERQARQAAQQAEADLKRLLEQNERQVNRLVEARLAEEFCGWLGGSRAVIAREAARALPREGQGDPLLEQAAAALEAQARADRASGTSACLQARLERLEAMLARCVDAMGQAMRPQPALLAASEALRAEADRLRHLLQGALPEGLPRALAAAVNSAPPETLGAWRPVIGQLKAAGALGADAEADLLACWHRRQAMLAQEAEPAPEAKADELETPRDRLRAVLRGQLPGVLLLDGHNVLFSLQARYRRPQDHVYPGRQAREWLAGDLVRMAAARPTCRVRVVFDGPERSDSAPAPNVGVIYSGGEGEHRADKVLVEEVRFFREASDQTVVLLVTNDGALAGEAARLGALPLPPTDLMPFLG